MKNFLIFFLGFSICASAQKLDRKTFYDYSESIEFRIYGLNKSRSVDVGAGNYSEIIMAAKGERFATFIFEFKNTSESEQIIDFETIFIKDRRGNLHNVMKFLKTGVRFTGKSFEQKIKGGKKFKVITIFEPPFPKDEIIDTLVINGNEIKLKSK